MPGETSCDGLSALDTVGGLTWECVEETAGVAFVSTALRPEAGLSDVIDFDAESGADCDALYPGTLYESASERCYSLYLPPAGEILYDAIGNDNLLCEAGEHCVYAPNFGAYQGHGALERVDVLGADAGRFEGVVLYAYAENGR